MTAIELARFTVPPADEDAVVAGHPAVVAALAAAAPGLRRAYLTREDGGRWLHVLVWDSRERADAAAAIAPGLPACAPWFGMLTEPEMHHADVIDEVAP